MKIDVLDMTDPELANAVLGFLLPYSDQIIRIYSQSNAVRYMIQQVMNFAPGSGVIDVLRIWGHGASGFQNVASGKSGLDSRDNDAGFYHYGGRDGVLHQNIGSLTPDLQLLTPLFSPNGHVELKGCGVAESIDGQVMIQKISMAMGRPVQASMVLMDTQAIASDGNGWTGIVIEASPDGSPPQVVQGSPL